MSTIYLLHYNNYYNRVFKKKDTIEQYAPYVLQSGDISAVFQNVNFNPNDFINAKQVVNWPGEHPDYFIQVENNKIVSRWFVIDIVRTTIGQLVLTLHRDLIADFFDKLLDAPIFIDKATVSDSSNLIFNNENMSFNQIKTSETFLKDETGCPWIVLYLARRDSEGNITSFSASPEVIYPYIDISLEQYNILKEYTGNGSAKIIFADPYGVNIKMQGLINNRIPTLYTIDKSGNVNKATNGQFSSLAFKSDVDSIVNSNAIQLAERVFIMGTDYAPPQTPESPYVYNNDLYVAIRQYNGVFLRVANGTDIRYYQIKIQQYAQGLIIPSTYEGKLTSALFPLISTYQSPLSVVLGSDISVDWNCGGITFTLDEVPAPTQSPKNLTISADRYHTVDAPYDIACMPLSNSLIMSIGSSAPITSSAYINLAVANDLISKYSGVGQLYDAQILPYCPLQNYTIIDSSGIKTFQLSGEDIGYDIITDNNTTPAGFIFYASQASFTPKIEQPDPIEITNYKIQNECDMYRICSPGYGAVFEFSAAKNDGVQSYNVVCTYKPYAPYIKVYPDFSRLYGSSYNDARGLICNDDYSLAMLNDAWATYELSNKNYQASFDRQIQNMEINNKYERIREAIGIGTNTLSAAGSGSAAGGMIGGGPGAITGGVIGGIASAAGGIADYLINEELRNETIDYTKDQFGYQLGNIKALPQTLSRTSAYNIDNKYFPFIEYYTCSDVEKKALANKIRYNGMTVGTIGSISEYLNNDWSYTIDGETIKDRGYIKGQLIYLNIDNSSIVQEISNELNQGIFFKGE